MLSNANMKGDVCYYFDRLLKANNRANCSQPNPVGCTTRIDRDEYRKLIL